MGREDEQPPSTPGGGERNGGDAPPKPVGSSSFFVPERPGSTSPRDEDLSDVLAEYSDLCAEGEDADLTEFLKKHPDLPADLVSELETCRELHELVHGAEPWSTLQLEDFQLVRVLGAGTFGIVYEARQISLDRRVALKVLQPRFLEDERAILRFQREARVIAKLQHDNIVRVHSTGLSKGTPFINMELVAGENLKRIITALQEAEESSQAVKADPTRASGSSQDGRVTRELLLELQAHGLDAYCRRMAGLFAGAAEGLQHANDRDVIHRDLKPSNLILDLDGDLRILDFGLARMGGVSTGSLTSGYVVGTPLYMSPEQFKSSHELEPSTDIYSLGATLYEALTLRPPFTGLTQKEIEEKIRFEDPLPLAKVRPGIPPGIDAIVRKCLEKNPGARFATAEALAQELRRFSRGMEIETLPPPAYRPWLRRAWRIANRVRAPVAVAVVLIAGVIAQGRYQASSKIDRDLYDVEIRKASEEIGWEANRRAMPRMDRAMGIGSRPQRVDWEPGTPDLSRGGGDVVRRIQLPETGTLLQVGALPASQALLEVAISRLRSATAIVPGDPRAYYYLAEAYILDGKRHEARTQLEEALDKRAGFVPALVLRARIDGAKPEGPLPAWAEKWQEGVSLQSQLEWDGAAAAFREAAALVEQDKEYKWLANDLRVRLGIAYLNDGKTSLLRLIGPEAGARLDVQLMAGRAYLAAGDARGAKDAADVLTYHYGDLLAKDEEHAVVFASLVSGIYREAGLRAEARDWAERALDLRQDSVPALLAAARAQLELGKTEVARIHLARASVRSFRNPVVLMALAAHYEHQKEMKEAMAALRLAIRLDNRNSQAKYHLARLLEQGGRRSDAMDLYAEVRDSGGVHAGLAANNRGVCLDLEGRLDEAEGEYRRAIGHAPQLVAARFNLGWTYQRQYRYSEAAREYRESMRLGLDDAAVYQNLGPCLHYLNKLDDAIVCYETAVKKSDDPKVLEVNYKSLGAAYDWKYFGDPQNTEYLHQAMKYYEAALEIDEDWAEARHAFGLMLVQLGRFAEAESNYRKATESSPEYLPPYNDLALILLEEHRELSPAELEAEIRMFEKVETQAGPLSAVAEILSRYREACLPRVTSYASIDWLIDRAETVPPDRSRRFVGPEVDAAWMQPGFDDASWNDLVSGSPAGPTNDPAVIQPSRAHLYLRQRLDTRRASAEGPFILRVRAPRGAAFEVHLNGQLVGFEYGGTHVGDSWQITHHYAIPPDLLRSGESWLTLHTEAAVDIDQAIAVLAPPPRPVRERRARAALEGFRAVADPVNDRARISYWEARLEALAGNHDRAASLFAGAAATELEQRPEPFLGYAESRRMLGAHEDAAEVLAEAIESGLLDDRLEDAWLQAVMVGLKRPPAEIRDEFPQPPGGYRKHAADLIWLLTQLEMGTVGINSGGTAYKTPGVSWGEDRFFLPPSPQNGEITLGARLYLRELAQETNAIEEAAVRLTTRVFWSHQQIVQGYSIPLTPGLYQVTLTFVEGWNPKEKTREFDILLEGEVRQEKYQPIRNGFGVFEDLPYDVEVLDGVLNIDFRRREDDPEVCAVVVKAL